MAFFSPHVTQPPHTSPFTKLRMSESAPASVASAQKELQEVSISSASGPERKERVFEKDGIVYKTYTSESQLQWITDLMKKDLSEPYSVYTYRYFINNYPDLCWLVRIELLTLDESVFSILTLNALLFLPLGPLWRQMYRCDRMQAR